MSTRKKLFLLVFIVLVILFYEISIYQKGSSQSNPINQGSKPLKRESKSIEIISGTLGPEPPTNHYWLIDTSSIIKVSNLEDSQKSFKVSFEVSTPECSKNYLLRFIHKREVFKTDFTQKDKNIFEFMTTIPGKSSLIIPMQIEGLPCAVPGDDRPLYLRVTNLKVT